MIRWSIQEKWVCRQARRSLRGIILFELNLYDFGLYLSLVLSKRYDSRGLGFQEQRHPETGMFWAGYSGLDDSSPYFACYTAKLKCVQLCHWLHSCFKSTHRWAYPVRLLEYTWSWWSLAHHQYGQWLEGLHALTGTFFEASV